MTEEEMARAGVVELTEVQFGDGGEPVETGKFYAKQRFIEMVEERTWINAGERVVYRVHIAGNVRHTSENPFLIGEW